tara:strand:+ start:2611 stop:2850 length:240 start_codon:yes stop_codon:yes gene_type:complete
MKNSELRQLIRESIRDMVEDMNACPCKTECRGNYDCSGKEKCYTARCDTGNCKYNVCLDFGDKYNYSDEYKFTKNKKWL